MTNLNSHNIFHHNYYRNYPYKNLSTEPYYFSPLNLPKIKTVSSHSFLDKFSNEIDYLTRSELSLAKKIAQAKKNPPAPNEEDLLNIEAKKIEQKKSFLTFIFNTMQQSMASITANFR